MEEGSGDKSGNQLWKIWNHWLKNYPLRGFQRWVPLDSYYQNLKMVKNIEMMEKKKRSFTRYVIRTPQVENSTQQSKEIVGKKQSFVYGVYNKNTNTFFYINAHQYPLLQAKLRTRQAYQAKKTIQSFSAFDAAETQQHTISI